MPATTVSCTVTREEYYRGERTKTIAVKGADSIVTTKREESE